MVKRTALSRSVHKEDWATDWDGQSKPEDFRARLRWVAPSQFYTFALIQIAERLLWQDEIVAMKFMRAFGARSILEMRNIQNMSAVSVTSMALWAFRAIPPEMREGLGLYP